MSKHPTLTEAGLSFLEFAERRVTVCRLNSGSVALSTYQNGTHHVFTLTVDEARHVADLLAACCIDPAQGVTA